MMSQLHISAIRILVAYYAAQRLRLDVTLFGVCGITKLGRCAAEKWRDRLIAIGFLVVLKRRTRVTAKGVNWLRSRSQRIEIYEEQDNG